ncbi:MAG: response regulator [Alphaproteobacteria bacterium]|jgi:two-component system, chemotaxis family, chemotaxis protein CheY|nr:response regulator [Alphaproteobacteria bacterium]MBT4019693.1 response regulator [Alphaproteobacteria bacterium]MBT5159119.1 response regulator [Alphaproteobacteria bacterium]MBT5918555.1 response regulator [Alphaproteobacteria bacterium]
MAIKRLDLSALNFLVIDDGQFMRLIIKQILRGLGATSYKEAEDGLEGLEILDNYPADIIILDIMMEPMNGIEFTRRFRASKGAANPKAPIIMLTAYSDGPALHQARDAGATEFINKPVSGGTLYSRIEEVILRPRQFVRCRSFVGPDRRRLAKKHDTGDRRRKGEDVSNAQ